MTGFHDRRLAERLQDPEFRDEYERQVVAALHLTPTMRRHLRELAELGPEAGWGPQSSGEWRCAEGLERRGLLDRNVSRGYKPFGLTKFGFEVGCALR